MSLAHAIPARARLSRSLLGWIAGGVALAALVTVVAIAVWPASATEQARSDGEQLGQAVSALSTAQTTAEVDAALTDIHTAAVDTRDHAGDAVADQVAAQQDALARAVDGFAGSHTSTDAFEVDLYQAELNSALDDLNRNAGDFRTEGPEVQQAFWEGYETGVTATS